MGVSRERDIAAWIMAVMSLKGVGPRTVLELLDAGREEILASEALDAALAESLAAGIPKAARIARALGGTGVSWDERLSSAYDAIEAAGERGVHVLSPFSGSYPKRLLRHKSHPPILYCIGSLAAINADKAVAVVGTRRPTGFGARMGRRLAQVLAEDGYAIVSGLAVGCDTLGHEGALDVGGMTVAVLPTPIGAPVYPRQNQGLADRIVESGGALLSEHAPDAKLSDGRLAGNLVARDEWQAALVDGVVAIETGVGGGTRHAMGHALRNGTPLAAFDYRGNERLRAAFETDPRFGGNMEYLTMEHGASPIYQPETIEAFKREMDAFRSTWQEASGAPSVAAGRCGQQALPLG